MANLIVILILLALVIPAVAYLIRAKKRGQTCIGCASGSKCGRNCHCHDAK